MVVEDSSCLDTNAIILKGTTVLTYKPRLLDRPFSGSLAGIEVGLHDLEKKLYCDYCGQYCDLRFDYNGTNGSESACLIIKENVQNTDFEICFSQLEQS